MFTTTVSKTTNYVTFLLLIGYLCSGIAFSQTQDRDLKGSLAEKVMANGKLFQDNLDQAFIEIEPLLQEATHIRDSILELKLLDRKCRYYYNKNEVGELITAARDLQVKASEYKDIHAQAMSHVFLAEAYSLNQLYNNSISELEKAMKILEKGNMDDMKIFFAKANTLLGMANVYDGKGELEKAVEKLQLVIRQYGTLKNPEDINRYQYLNYSNLAMIYARFNVDSAEHYAYESIRLKPDGPEDKIMMTNYFVLGRVNRENNDNETALQFFEKAFEISEKSGVLMISDELYKNMAELYSLSGNLQDAQKFENKLKELELSLLKSKYNSLQKVLDKTDLDNPEKNTNNLGIKISIFLLCISLVIISIYFKKRKSRQNPTDTYNTLIEMIQKNDPAFMFTLEKIHPGFSEKLLAINPQLMKSEIEFCALLKLNLSTKKIAQLKFIEPRTVQNKKHHIRKKLNIPTSVDIYNWFDAV